MEQRRQQLSAAVRARTIIAACDTVRVRPADETAGDTTGHGHLGVLVDRYGGAHLVISPNGQAPTGRVVITCRSGVPGLGVLRLEGTCGPARQATADDSVHHLLTLHRPRWEAHHHLEPGHDEHDVLTAAIAVTAIRVLVPALPHARARSVHVPLSDYLLAGPDHWSLDTGPLATLLEREHQQELRRLAAAHVPDAAGAVTVAVRGIGPDHLDVTCLSLAGVTSIAIPFGEPVEHPGAVRHWLQRAANQAA